MSATGPAQRWLPWLAIAVAFSPTLADFAGHLLVEPHDWYALLAPLLLVGLVLRSDVPPVEPRRPAAAAVLAVAVGLQLVGFASWSLTLARLGLAVGVFGGALWTGILPASAALLALAMVPLPTSLVTVATPAYETALAHAAAGLAGLVGVAAEVSGPLIRVAGERLEVQPQQNGARLAVVLAGLGWYATQASGGVSLGRLARVAGLALLAFPIQGIALVVAVLILATAGAAASAAWLLAGVWVGVAVLGLAWIEWRRAAARASC